MPKMKSRVPLEFSRKIAKIVVRREVCVISPTSDITEGCGDMLLRKEVFFLVSLGLKYFVLDLKKSKLRGSSIGDLIHIMTELDKQGCILRLCCLGEFNLDKLTRTKGLSIFSTYATRREAINSFRSGV